VGLALCALAGCAHPAEGPQGTLTAFAAAVEHQDYARAYALTSAEFQKRTPLSVFRATLDAGGADAQQAARRLSDRTTAGPLRVSVALDLGETLPLVSEDGRWRVDAQPFELWSQATPRAALRTFIRAMERRRFDIALRLVPRRSRAEVSEAALRGYWEGERRSENLKLLERLRAAVASAPIVELGDEAHMPYGEGQEARFVREDGAWKIEDPD
jgi:hypothetical protein